MSIEASGPYVRDGQARPVSMAAVLARGRFRSATTLMGPAFVSAVAYVDLGNFATNLSAGARYGYALLWVVVAANLMAMLVQYLSARLGVISGMNLAEICRLRMPTAVTRGLWVQAEVVAMATDLAEFVGAAIGLHLLFGTPPIVAGLITAGVSYLVLALHARGQRSFELGITALLIIVLLGFTYQLVATHPVPASFGLGLVPGFAGQDQVLLASGIVGATVMPHAIYVHSALTSGRISCADDDERNHLLLSQRLDVILGLGSRVW